MIVENTTNILMTPPHPLQSLVELILDSVHSAAADSIIFTDRRAGAPALGGGSHDQRIIGARKRSVVSRLDASIWFYDKFSFTIICL